VASVSRLLLKDPAKGLFTRAIVKDISRFAGGHDLRKDRNISNKIVWRSKFKLVGLESLVGENASGKGTVSGLNLAPWAAEHVFC
jgi:hypothetical protein